jgi:hypothetical protein
VDQPPEIPDVADDRQPVRRDRGVERSHIADGGEARRGVLEGLREPGGLSRRPDDQRPEREPSIPLEAQPVGLPPSSCQQLEDDREQPRQSEPGPRERGLGPVAGHDDEDNPQAAGADDAPELVGWREVLGRVEVERLERGHPQRRGDQHDGQLQGGHGSRAVADVVDGDQRRDDAGGVADGQAHRDCPVPPQCATGVGQHPMAVQLATDHAGERSLMHFCRLVVHRL